MITDERIKVLIEKEFGVVQYTTILPQSGHLYIKIFAQLGYLKFNSKFLWKC